MSIRNVIRTGCALPFVILGVLATAVVVLGMLWLIASYIQSWFVGFGS